MTAPTPKLTEELCDALSNGAARGDAARFVGSTARQVRAWLKSEDAFRAAVTRAQEQAKVRATAYVLDAAERDWKAAAWWLERRAPAEGLKGAKQKGVKAPDLSRYVHMDDVIKLLGQVGEAISEAIEDEGIRSRVALRITALTQSITGAA